MLWGWKAEGGVKSIYKIPLLSNKNHENHIEPYISWLGKASLARN